MNAPPAVKSTWKGDLVYETMRIPVATYKSEEVYGISGSLFHSNCGGKIIQPRKCELHPEEEDPITYSAIQVDDGSWVELDSTTKDFLMGSEGQEMRIVSVHPLSMISDLMVQNQLIPLTVGEVAPQKMKKQKTGHSVLWASLMDRLRIKKRFMLVHTVCSNMERYGIILPGGRMFLLFYQEEIREQVGYEGEPDATLRKPLDALIKALEMPFPDLSCAPVMERVSKWLSSNTGKTQPAIIANKAPIVDLEQMLESALAGKGK